MKKSKFKTLAFISSIGILGLVFSVTFSQHIFNVNAALFLSSASSKTGNAYSFTLNSSNSPTTSSVFTFATGSVNAGDDNYNLSFDYSSVKAANGVHAILEENSSIKRTDNAYTRGVDSVSAHYSGGTLFVKYGLSDALHYKQIPSDGTALSLDSSYTFNKFEIYAKNDNVTLTDMTIGYHCASESAENGSVSQGTINVDDGVVVSGLTDLRTAYEYGEEQIFHVQALDDYEITSVKVNGYELEEDSRFDNFHVDNGYYYSFYPGPSDVIDIETNYIGSSSSVSEGDVTVGVYYINESTGAISPIGTGEYVVSASDIDYAHDYYVEITAPDDITGYTISDGYYPNQDYIRYEKGSNSTINFYYSKLDNTFSSASSSLSGSGTEANPYLITSVEDWAYFTSIAATSDTSYYKLTKSLDFTNLPQYQQMWGTYYTTIGSANTANCYDHATNANLRLSSGTVAFSGNFDGNYCAVRSLSLPDGNIYNGETLVASYRAKGLFAVINSGGIVKNVSTYGSVYHTDSNNNTGNGPRARLGGIAGINAGTINNCNNYALVSLHTCRTGIGGNDSAAGGVAGDISGCGSATSLITNSNNYGIVQQTNTANDYYVLIGGVVGSSTGTSKAKTISNCNNFGNVNGGSRSRMVGGIAAIDYYGSNLTLNDCNNFGTVYAGRDYCGGIIARSVDLNAINCTNYGTCSVGQYSYCGGITSYSSGVSTISGCENYGSCTTITIYCGGLVGYDNGTSLDILNSTNYGPCTSGGNYCGGLVGNKEGTLSVTSSTNFGTCTCGASYCGGLVGSTTSTSTFISCANYGDCSAVNSFAGGITSLLYAGEVSDSNNFGTISITTGSGTQINAGGLIGLARNVTITGSNNFGRVEYTGETAMYYIGGFVGFVQYSSDNTGEFYINYDGSDVNGFCANFGDVYSTTGTLGAAIGYTSGSASLTVDIYNFLNVGNLYTGGASGSVGVAGVVGQAGNNSVVSVYNSVNAGKISVASTQSYGAVIATGTLANNSGNVNYGILEKRSA